MTSTKSVTFNKAVAVVRTLHISNYTDEEVFDTWFSPKEYKQMKREVKLTVSMMEKKANFTEGVNFSSHGLEGRTTDQMVERKEHRFASLDAVLDEQDRQRELEICDPIALRNVYVEYSFNSHMSAFLLGATNEKFALEYLGELKKQPALQQRTSPQNSSCIMNKGDNKSCVSSLAPTISATTKVASRMARLERQFIVNRV